MINKLLSDYNVVLASASPRRKLIFELLGINALQYPSGVDEIIDTDNPRKYVQKQAGLKARSVAAKMDKDCVVVAADTIVYYEDKILEKPLDKAEAVTFLKNLSGNKHYVYTGICVLFKGQCYCDYEKTTVYFDEMSDQVIDDYVSTDEPMDKAGAYGIQGAGGQFVKKVSGCYFNVMGFPVNRFYRLVQKMFRE